MKNKTIKISLFILALTLFSCAVFAMTVSASDSKTPEIISQNVKYGKEFKLMYAVDASTVNEGPVTLEIYETDPVLGGTVKYTYTADTPETVEKLEKECYVFTTNGISYTSMAQNFYIKAVDNKGKESAVKRYSVAEYLYERLADTTATSAQVNFYKEAIDFGASAEVLLNGKAADAQDLMTNLAYVVIDGGTVDGYATGIYPIGSELNLKADNGSTSAKWSLTTYVDGEKTNELTGLSSVEVQKADINVVKLNLINYRAERTTYETQTVGTDFTVYNAAWGSDDSNCTYHKYESDSEKGVVKKYVFSSGMSSHKNILYSDAPKAYATIVDSEGNAITKETATAVELSFDMKIVNTSGNKMAGDQFVEVGMSASGSSYGVHRIQLRDGANIPGQSYSMVTTGLAVSSHNTNWAANGCYDDIDASEWFNIRIVYYKGVRNAYVYINGSTEPLQITSRNDSTWEGDITTLDRLCMNIGKSIEDGLEVYFDNYFYGYTFDTLPE